MTTYPREFLIVCDEAGSLLGASAIDHDTVKDRMGLPRPIAAQELELLLPSSASLIAQVSELQAALKAANAAKEAAVQEKTSAEAALESANDMIAQLRAGTSAPGCTDLQGRMALKAAGLLDAVLAMVDGLPPTDTMSLYWDRSTFWREDSPVIAQFAAALGMNDDQKVALFAAARAIEV